MIGARTRRKQRQQQKHQQQSEQARNKQKICKSFSSALIHEHFTCIHISFASHTKTAQANNFPIHFPRLSQQLSGFDARLCAVPSERYFPTSSFGAAFSSSFLLLRTHFSFISPSRHERCEEPYTQQPQPSEQNRCIYR